MNLHLHVCIELKIMLHLDLRLPGLSERSRDADLCRERELRFGDARCRLPADPDRLRLLDLLEPPPPPPPPRRLDPDTERRLRSRDLERSRYRPPPRSRL